LLTDLLPRKVEKELATPNVEEEEKEEEFKTLNEKRLRLFPKAELKARNMCQGLNG
jgi:hypothetical protein